jgi:16S rRNA (guanine527-N7)-methyltransferase
LSLRGRPFVPKPPEVSILRPSSAAFAAALTRDRETVLERRNVSRETRDRLDAFAALLLKWQASINLVAPSTASQLWSRHIEDGLALFDLAPERRQWVDLGSGGGLPGIVLAIQLRETGGHIDLVESNNKKAAFLRTAVRELDVPARIHAARIESVGAVIGSADTVTARALASLDQLLAWVGADLRPDAICLFAKGRDHEREIAAASALWRYDMVKHDPKTADGSVILRIADLRRRNDPSPA